MIRNRIAYNPYTSYRLKLSRADGSYLWDDQGKRYLDFTSGWNVTNLGWNHPEIAEAIIAQVNKNTFAPLWGSDPVQETYAEALTAPLPEELDVCIKTTSGTEAVEVAIKVARAATGRKKIIGFKHSYHGQLFASMALGFNANLVQAITPLVPEFIQIDYPRETGDSSALKSFLNTLDALLVKKDVAAIVTEPGIITGWGTAYVAPPGFLRAVRECTKKQGTVLIVDEVGTGFSRTGKLFGLQHESVIPDMVCLAKGISNGGAAIGAVIGKRDIIERASPFTNLTSTFGWTPLACAAALKTLEIHQREKTWEQSQSKGDYLTEQLKVRTKDNPVVADIRGIGMEIGLELKGDKRVFTKILSRVAENGLHVMGGSGTLFQIMPPITISQADLDEGLDVLIGAINTCS